MSKLFINPLQEQWAEIIQRPVFDSKPLEERVSSILQDVKQNAPFDVVVTMGCGDACPWMPAKKFIDWEIPDPKDMNEEDFKKVLGLIEIKVKDLLKSL